MNSFSARKATATLRIVHADGTPVAGKQLRLRQTSHQFLFGCGAFDAYEMMRDDQSPETMALLDDRMQKWLALFNYGTLPFYWARYQKEKDGPTVAPELLKAASWLKERGVTVKGHPLCWHTACADWLMDFSNEEILRRQLERIRRDVSMFQGVIDMWDMINEVVIMPVFDRYDNAITRVCREQGRVNLVKQVFQAAHETNPGATLLINDFNTSMAYEVLIDALLCAGVPIGAIGIQSHQHQGYWGLEKLNAVLERFGRFGLPIHFTENTLISGDLMPPEIVDLNDWQVPEWPSTPEGEARQADEFAEMYTTLFRHPLVQAITTWDPVDGCWLGAPSGVMRADNTPKPAYERLMQLIHHDWTTDVTLTTSEDGIVVLQGFKGQYSASLGERGCSFTLADDGAQTLTLA